MLGADTSGGQSSRGFLHWLKNTWLGKLWNRIVNFFRPKKQNTESLSVSEKAVNGDNNNGRAKSPEVVQNEVNELSKDIGGVCEDVQKRDSGSLQAPIDPKSPVMSQSKSESTLIPPLELPAKRLLRSKSLPANLNDISKQEELEWDHTVDKDSPKKDETQGYSSHPKQKLGSSDTGSSTDIEKGDDEVKKRKHNKSKTQHISRSDVTRNQLKEKEKEKKVLKNKEKINKENEEKGKEILEKSEERQRRAEERKKIADQKKSERAKSAQRRNNVGCFTFVHNDNNPSPNLSYSSSSLSSQNGKGH